MDSAKLKFAKKPLRVQPCKTLPPTLKPAKPSTAPMDPKTAKSKSAKPAPVPKGNPELGEKLKGLSKEDRKIAKSVDAERQARRMAKKKLRHGMDRGEGRDRGAVKLGASKVGAERKVKVKAKKGRVRSEHALQSMKGART